MKIFAAKIKHELLELLPPTVFFFIAFHILAFSRMLMLGEYGISVSALAGVAIGSLLVGKAVLLADLLPFVNRFPHKPLIYNVFWKTAIYFVAVLLIHYLEHILPIWWHTGDWAAANHHLREELVWRQFWLLQLWMLVLLFAYCVIRELSRVLGPKELRKIFFGTSNPQSPNAEA